MTDSRVEHGEESWKTSPTLLGQVKQRDPEAWQRFVHLYAPLVSTWCRRFGLQDADADDVGQDVFRTVAESIDSFHLDRKGDTLRGWLWTVTRNRVVDLVRRQDREAEAVGGSGAQARFLALPEGEPDSGSVEEDENFLIRRAADMVLDGCKEETRQAFLRVVVGGQRPADVARDLGMTPNAVYLAKSHVLRRIREEFAQLVEV